MSAYWKVCSYTYALNTWSVLHVHEWLHQCGVAWTRSFSSSAPLGLVSLIFLLTIPIDSLWGSGQASLLDNQAQWYHGNWTRFWYFWQCGQEPSHAGKLHQHLHKACQQKEAWSAQKCPGCVSHRYFLRTFPEHARKENHHTSLLRTT